MICLTTASYTPEGADKRRWINPDYIKEMRVSSSGTFPCTFLAIYPNEEYFVEETPETILDRIGVHNSVLGRSQP